MSRKRYLIIGDGAAGTTAAQRLRELDREAYVTILSDDPQPAYFRAALTNYLLGELREDQIFAVPPSFYGDYSIHRMLTRVAAVEPARSQLWLAQGGAPLAYDALLVASGARANSPTFDGAHLPGVMTMRTLQDVRAVMDLCKSGLREAVVIGGGPLALEWAHGLVTRGVKVTMMIREPRFLPGVLDAVASDLLLARLRQGGVDVRVSDVVVAAMPGPGGRVAGVRTQSGATIPAQLVAAAIGVVCNTEFLQSAGLALSPQRGLLVDERLRTGAPNVFAAGDVAAVKGRLLQLWEPARVQGRIAARNMVGGADELYTPGAHYMATRLYDLDCAAIGESSRTPEGAEEVVEFPQRTGKISYKKLVFQGGRLIGALLFGQREERVRLRGRALKTLIDEGVNVRAIQRELLDSTFDLPGWLRANKLAERPPVSLAGGASPGAAPARAPAKVIGTQAVMMMPDVRAAAAPDAAPAGAAPTKPKAATMAVVMPGVKPPDLAGVVLTASVGRFALKGASALIGRDPSSQVPLSDGMVSSSHAQITRSGDAVYVRDLGSSNGTWVNGAPVTVPRRLHTGDRVRVGGVELVVAIEGDVAAAAGPATGGPSEAIPHLEVRSGSALGLSFALTPPTVRIGRDPACAVRLEDPTVAPMHAELREHGGVWHVADLQTPQGLGKSGAGGAGGVARVAPGQWVPLAEGDLLYLGQVVLAYTRSARSAHAWADMSQVGPRSALQGGVR